MFQYCSLDYNLDHIFSCFLHRYTPLPFYFFSHFGKCGKKRKHRDTNSYIWPLKDGTEQRTLFPYLFSTCHCFKICCRVWIKLHVLLLSIKMFKTSSVFFYKYGINSFFLSMLFAGREHFVVLGREQNSLKKMHYPAQWALIYFFICLSHLFISIASIYLWVWRVGNCLFKIWMTLEKRGWVFQPVLLYLWGIWTNRRSDGSGMKMLIGVVLSLVRREGNQKHAWGDPRPGLLLSLSEPLPQKPCFPPCSRTFWNVAAALLLSFPGLYVGVTSCIGH